MWTETTTPRGPAPPKKGGEPTKTLRDEFAMAALAGMLANQGRVGDFAKRTRAADEAYYWADAMLAARQAQS